MPPPDRLAARRLDASPSPAPPPGDRLVALLRTSHFLRTVPEPVIERLTSGATARALSAGDALWREGDIATCFHVIVNGLITIRRGLASGAEVIVAIFGSRENVGDTAAIEGAPYPADAVVSSDHALVIRLDVQRVVQQSALSPELSAALQQALCRHSAALRTKVDILSAGSVKARLAQLFVHLAGRFGDELADGTVVVPVALARTTLASLVSARTETVIRILRPWETEGLVVTRDGAFYLRDLATLAACSDDG